MAKKGKQRTNTHFRQTAKEFKAARQAQVFGYFKRSLPDRIFKITKPQFLNKISKINISKRKRTTLFVKKLSKDQINKRK